MKEFNQAYFKRFYGLTDKKNPESKLKAYKRELESITGVEIGLKILDVGCGYGGFLRQLGDNWKTFGIDVSSYAIEYAKKLSPKTDYRLCSVSDLKSKSEFDAVTAFDSLEHVPNVDISLINISRALKQNGTFICVVPVYDGLFGLISGLLDYDSTHVNKKSRDYWLKKFSKYFEIIQTKGILRKELFGELYWHFMSSHLAGLGQAILVKMKKI